MSKNDLTADSWLTVKEAADLTNLSIPTFYTPQRKRDFGYDSKSGDVWMIPVQLLIKHGLLTKDLEPTRAPRTLQKVQSHEIESLLDELHNLRSEVSELRTSNAVMKALLGEKDKQLEMLNRLIPRSNK